MSLFAVNPSSLDMDDLFDFNAASSCDPTEGMLPSLGFEHDQGCGIASFEQAFHETMAILYTGSNYDRGVIDFSGYVFPRLDTAWTPGDGLVDTDEQTPFSAFTSSVASTVTPLPSHTATPSELCRALSPSLLSRKPRATLVDSPDTTAVGNVGTSADATVSAAPTENGPAADASSPLTTSSPPRPATPPPKPVRPAPADVKSEVASPYASPLVAVSELSAPRRSSRIAVSPPTARAKRSFDFSDYEDDSDFTDDAYESDSRPRKKRARVSLKHDTPRWPCSHAGCRETFSRDTDVKRHVATVHDNRGKAQIYEEKRDGFRKYCRFCAKILARPDARLRHEQETCKKNPALPKKVRKTRAKPSGPKPPQPMKAIRRKRRPSRS
ncbi:hypothetical protein PLICRDRAFT_56790 [Plicaturopsis crispa FD-325 SS-3]|nr:hypothetical protein PLICRDRAFT_56790 [Plicaturopsis crispa FD-325 SS-3]